MTLGDAGSLCRSADLVHAVAEGLSSDGVLTTHGDGDGGLFTGILVRYLALAAGEPRLAEETRHLARTMVTQTAEAFWSGRAPRVVRRAEDVVVFSPHPLRPASTDPSVVVELSTQLQAWMTLEAAAVVGAVDG